jgi:hypothetical protein
LSKKFKFLPSRGGLIIGFFDGLEEGGDACYTEDKPEYRFIWKPYKQ